MAEAISRSIQLGDALLREIERFLFEDAELLDQWKLHEWVENMALDGHYLIPATDKPDGDPTRDLFLVQDDRFLLEQRIDSLLTRSAHAEYPHSRTRRLITNVRVVERGDNRYDVAANFAVYRIRSGAIDTYVGHYRHVLERDESGALKFWVRKAVLDLDALRPHGKVSIIL
ncbi:MAG: p-cumate 2,3-dioxygenase subunit beta [Mycobacterium sp.]|jgi:p-cumate 2,3-dioxygenase beta subunit|nr:p-cumate 2,3-dioxygenase subunit beta [Mycobacterium sp.]MDT5345419.1 p-cumate 2,3-dioxygenase subunit beta [Mycobacterium sp.]